MTISGGQGSYDDTPLGVSNVSREYVRSATRQVTSPQVIYVECLPYVGWTQGWNNADSLSSPPSTPAALDVSADKDADLFPMTLTTRYWLNEIWPAINNILGAGVGERSPVSAAAAVRYFAMWLRAYQIVYVRLVANHLAYRMDWSQHFPFTAAPPASIFRYAQQLGAQDTDLASTWLPLRKRLERYVHFPGPINAIKRAYTPMLSMNMGAKIVVPMLRDFPSLSDVFKDRDLVEGYLDYLAQMPEEVNTLFSFIPLPVSRMNIWDISPPVADVDRWTGMFNSGLSFDRGESPFGDTGDPDPRTQSMYWVSGSATPAGVTEPTSLSFLSRQPLPLWREVKWSTIFKMIANIADDTFQLATLHGWGQRTFVDDLNVATTIGADNDFNALVSVNKYSALLNSKYWASNNLKNDATWEGGIEGVPDFGYLYADIASEPLERLVRLDVENEWEYPALRVITTAGIGSSLRSIRPIFEGIIRAMV